jgi:RHS repeat-associated protein
MKSLSVIVLLILGITIHIYSTNVVGTLPGSFGVSPSGAATYAIPIDLPAGRMGMTPSISLLYNSQSVGNVLGRGWGLSGFSSISRANSTPYYNGYYDNIDFTDDELVLDGQHLITIGSNMYGTEIETYSKIELLTGDFGRYFLVHRKDGTIAEYGNSIDSRQMYSSSGTAGSDDPLAWHINEIYDRQGNNIVFKYQRDITNGEIHPEVIEYGSVVTHNGKSTGEEKFTRIYFEYNKAMDVINRQTSYYEITKDNVIQKYESQNTQLLVSISISYNHTISKKYIIEYAEGSASVGEPCFIKNITLTNPSIPVALNSTTFNWSFYTPDYNINTTINSYDAFMLPNAKFISLDLYGANRETDALYYAKIDPAFPDDFKHVIAVGNDEISVEGHLYSNQLAVFDWDSNGDDEIVFVDDDGIKIYDYNRTTLHMEMVYLYPYQRKIFTGDFTGDNVADILLVSDAQAQVLTGSLGSDGIPYYTLSSNTLTLASKEQIETVADFNGDGKSEILWRNTPAFDFTTYSFSTTTSGFTPLASANLGTYALTKKVYFADFNADGKTDICLNNTDFADKGKHTWFSFGDGFIDPMATTESDVLSPQFVEDFNNDGRADFATMEFSGSGITVKIDYTQPDGISTIMKSSSSNYPTGLYFTNIEATCTSDMDGNGIRDIIIAGSREIALKTPHYHELSVFKITDEGLGKDLITQITDGHGVSTLIEYTKFGIDSDLVTGFPLCKFRNKDYVVSEAYDLGENNEKWNRTTYTYKTPITHLTGKGFLGYKETSSISWKNSLMNTSRYEILLKTNSGTKFYYYSYPSVVSTWSIKNGIQNKLLSETTNTIDVKVSNAGDARYLPVITKSVTKSWDNDVDNSYKGIVIQNQKISDIDEYGNPLQNEMIMDELATDPEPSKYNWKKTVINTYESPDITNWIIGLPQTSEVTTYHLPEDPSIEAENKTLSKYYYQGANSTLIDHISIVPNGISSLTIEKWYTYDDYGNVISETIKSAPDNYQEDRTTEYVYSPEYENRFVSKLTVKAATTAEDQVTTFSYDPVTGNLLSQTSNYNDLLVNMLVTSYSYDGLGKLKKTTQPDKTSNEFTIDWSSNFSLFTPPANSLYYSCLFKNLNGSSNKWNTTLTFYDKYSRPLRTVTQGLNGELIYSDVIYDNLGRVSQLSEPYFATGSPTQWTTNGYDDIGRIEKQTLPTGAEIIIETKGLLTKSTNTSTDVWEETTVNALGQPEIIRDPKGIINNNYDAASRIRSINSQGVITFFEYDKAGNQIKVTDPDAGVTTSTYYAFGDLKTQTDARNNLHSYSYDKLGRVIKHTLIPDNEKTDYSYVNVAGEAGFGQVKTITKTFSNNDQVITAYTYDNFNRAITKTEKIDGMIITFAYGYDPITGMLSSYTYPSNYRINYNYNSYGYMNSVNDFNNGTPHTLWLANSTNARGQLKNCSLGNGLTTTKQYDNYGFPKSIVTKNAANTEMQNLFYTFDKFTGNLYQKWERVNSSVLLSETYGYDPILKERLTSWQVNSSTPFTMQYADNGNIQTKSEVTQPTVGKYTYGDNAGPHAVTGITNPTPNYLSKASNQGVYYNGSNKVKTIEYGSGGEICDITYGTRGDRVKSYVYTYIKELGNPLKTIYYFNDFEIHDEKGMGGSIKYLHYIYAGSGLAAIIEIKNDVTTPFYVLSDFQGTYNVITNGAGAKVENLSFDPWGRRRNPTTWTYTNVPTTFLFDRGYTGHEHLDRFGLINMNGRVYDPTLARFLSPDPILQNPGYTQSHNRYSYCLNNPLKYTDPSGYSYKPDDWNKFGGVVSMTFGFGPGLSGRLGPGSGNHWSDNKDYSSEYRNLMLMSSNTFNNMYGSGASDIGNGLLSNSYSLNQWRQGLTSINTVRQEGGYYIQGSTVGTSSSQILIRSDGVDYANDLSGGEIMFVRVNVAAGKGGSGWLDNLQTGLDVAGIADPTGLVDLGNALIYAGRGQWGNAGISALAIIPYIGDLGKAGRLGAKATGLSYELIHRAAKGADGGLSRHVIERLDGEIISKTHQVFNDGKIIHQHQNHIGTYGTIRTFPEEWLLFPTIK